MAKIKTCIYHRSRFANKECTGCGANLCKYCGKTDEDGSWCDNCKQTVVRSKRIISF